MARRLESPKETMAFGAAVGGRLKSPVVLALFGDLGTGKTTFVKGLISAVAKISPHEVTSPTFTYLQVYEGPLFHFDLYRLEGWQAFVSRGFDEYFGEGIVVIEWAERIEAFLPLDTIRITCSYGKEGIRIIEGADSI